MVLFSHGLDPIPILMFENEGGNSCGINILDLQKFASPPKNRPVGQKIKRYNTMLCHLVGNDALRAMHEILEILFWTESEMQHVPNHGALNSS